MPTIWSRGAWIDWEQTGQGRPIVLVHGFSSNREQNWRASGWVDTLVGAGRRVVLLDCRGHGRSDKPHSPSAYHIHTMADDVAEVMRYANLHGPTDLMGYSMGARISLHVALRHPQRLRSLVLGGLGVRGLPGTPSGEHAARALLAPDPAAISDPALRAFRSFVEQSGNDLVALACVQRAEPSPPDRAAMAQLKIPTLVAAGEKDDLARDAAELAALIGGAEHASIPEGDHLTTVAHLRFKQVVLDFLARQDARRAEQKARGG